MANLFRNFDRISFWMGFLAASLFWFLLARLRPYLRRMWDSLRAQAEANRLERGQSDEIRLGNDTLRYAQGWHLGAPLFSLDEILIPARLLAPAVPPMAYEPPPSEDITDWALPDLPDWPELASYYGAPWLTPLEALQAGANLALIGQPGSGKTVTLASLACQMIRKDPQIGALERYVPVLVHASDLPLPPPDPQDPLSSLLAALSTYVTSIPAKRLPIALHNLFQQDHALLLVDGLDELPPTHLEPVVAYLSGLMSRYPGLRAVVAANPDYLDGLKQAGFQPLPLTTWGAPQRALFISRWADLWNRYIAGKGADKKTPADPLLVIGWLLNNTEFLTPLELTLKVWAAFAGDALGAAPLAALESYLRRMLAGQPARNRQVLEQIAAQMALTQEPLVERRVVEAWLGGENPAAASAPDAPANETPGGEGPASTAEKGASKKGSPKNAAKAGGKAERPRAGGALADLLNSGLLEQRSGERLRLAHPALAGYLAAQVIAARSAGDQIAGQPEWLGKAATLNYLSILDSQAGWMGGLIQDEKADPLLRGLLNAARWLRSAPEGLPWIPGFLRRLAVYLQNEDLPLGLKARIVSALTLSGNSGIPVLLRQMSAAPQAELRQLAALGLGALRDTKSINEIIHLLDDPTPGVSRAATLALATMGEKSGLEAVAEMLLSGDESQRRAAAEGLANHPEEGYPTLEEASQVEDPAVRRAAVFGLARTRQGWAVKLLEKMRAEDKEWLVQDAANQVLQALTVSNPRTPRPLPPLPQTAWLVAFAAERGMAVAPGKPAYDLLYRSLKEGSDDQRLAALYYLTQREDEGAVLPLYQTYFSQRGELRDRAWDTLWSLSATGIPLPPPVQFGLK